MSKFLRAAAIVAIVVSGATFAQAQTVGMVGEYSEGNGIIVNIPQNPPIIDCATSGTWAGQNEARCLQNKLYFFGTTLNPAVYNHPHHGVVGARNIATAGGAGTRPNGLNVGDPFVIPPIAMQQRLGQQVGIVLNNVVIQLDTTFTAGMPGTSRGKNPNVANTRRMSAMNWSLADVQDNGLTGASKAVRAAAATVVTRTIANETLAMTFTPGANQFGGTATVLLDGNGRLYLGGPAITGAIPPTYLPAAGSNPVGDTVAGFNERNAAGWNYTITGTQMAGKIKAFPSAPAVVAPACGALPPPSPAGCNEINGFDTNGFTLAPIPGATSVKHMFAWTTGTVQIVRTAVRGGGAYTQTDIVTGMGYDTITTDGTVQNRNVGMVAGSYTVRTDGVPQTQLNTQMVGIDFKFTPEPGATVALISGLGLLGTLATRRRR